jgi:hypothetical protein
MDVIHSLRDFLLKEEWTKIQDPQIRRKIAVMGGWFIGSAGFELGCREKRCY